MLLWIFNQEIIGHRWQLKVQWPFYPVTASPAGFNKWRVSLDAKLLHFTHTYCICIYTLPLEPLWHWHVLVHLISSYQGVGGKLSIVGKISIILPLDFTARGHLSWSDFTGKIWWDQAWHSSSFKVSQEALGQNLNAPGVEHSIFLHVHSLKPPLPNYCVNSLLTQLQILADSRMIFCVCLVCRLS